MQSEATFDLDAAGWPALLVDAKGAIYRANTRACEILEIAATGNPPPLASIWAADNPLTPEQYLAHSDGSPATAMLLRFQGLVGRTVAALTMSCPTARNGQKCYILQLLPEHSASPAEPRSTSGETTVIQKQKLDCALQLARTVALDFNNALTTILGHTSLVLTKMEPDHPWRSSLIEVEKSAAKAAEIAIDLGTFSRQDKESRGQMTGNLNGLLQRTVEVFQQKTTPHTLAWSLQLDRKLFAARFDEAKMQQVFLKILENSVEALSRPGRISLQTRNLELAGPTQDRTVQLAAGTYICAEISDDGCGIEPAVLPRIFEPFFTTKRGGAHRGLGLAWVYGVVTNHGGGVAVSSRPDAGTSVRIYLPAEKCVATDDHLDANDLTGTETILLVDDEDLLLTMGQTVLSAYGYHVLTANSGQKALDLLTREDAAVDLVITDLVMPGMGGRELVEHIDRLAPQTRILCTTGCVWPAGQISDSAFLQKPFTSQQLLRRVRQALASENQH